MRTQGSAGFSGGDAESWRRQLHSFGDSSNALAEAMALAAKRLCTEFVDPAGIIANRLIPLDKDPGTRPIGVGEVMSVSLESDHGLNPLRSSATVSEY